MIPTVVAHYHARMESENNSNVFFFSFEKFSFSLDQISNFDSNNVKYEPMSYSSHPQAHHLQVSNSPYTQQSQVLTQHQFDFNHNYHNGRTNLAYPLSQMATPIGPTTSLPTPTVTSNPINNTNHPTLGPRYSGGSTCSNVLMLPPAHHPRGGSLPDLRNENSFHHQQISFSTTPSPPNSIGNQQFFRSSSPQQNGDSDLYLFVRFLLFRKKDLIDIFRNSLESSTTIIIECWSIETKSKYSSTS